MVSPLTLVTQLSDVTPAARVPRWIPRWDSICCLLMVETQGQTKARPAERCPGGHHSECADLCPTVVLLVAFPQPRVLLGDVWTASLKTGKTE